MRGSQRTCVLPIAKKATSATSALVTCVKARASPPCQVGIHGQMTSDRAQLVTPLWSCWLCHCDVQLALGRELAAGNPHVRGSGGVVASIVKRHLHLSAVEVSEDVDGAYRLPACGRTIFGPILNRRVQAAELNTFEVSSATAAWLTSRRSINPTTAAARGTHLTGCGPRQKEALPVWSGLVAGV